MPTWGEGEWSEEKDCNYAIKYRHTYATNELFIINFDLMCRTHVFCILYFVFINENMCVTYELCVRTAYKHE